MPDSSSSSSYEGRQSHIPGMEMPAIESWEFQYPGSETSIEVSIPEFTCICPKTGLPDFATLQITYTPVKDCLELKSLNEYILHYRDIGIFHEHVTNEILNDLVKSCAPRRMTLVGEFNARGGIKTTVTASYP